jgi:hypothetical protein
MLALRHRDRANKDEIEIFVSSVTSNNFPHGMLLLRINVKPPLVGLTYPPGALSPSLRSVLLV